MSVRVNVRMSKVMSTLIKVGVRTYATYASFLTLPIIDVFIGDWYYEEGLPLFLN